MKDLWKTIRLAAYVFALPLIATAAVSAHQFFQDSDTVAIVSTPKVETSTVESVGLGETYRRHTVSMNDQGQISGRVWLVDSASNSKNGLGDSKVFFMQGETVVAQVYTDPDGTFDVSGLSPGAYSFVVSNVEGVAAYGVNIVEDGFDGMMDVVVVSRNAKRVQKIIEEGRNAGVAEKLTSELVMGSNTATLINGELEGRIYASYQGVDFSDSKVRIYDAESKLVNEVVTDASGHFVVTNMTPGYYEFVSEGPQGFAAFGFEAVNSGAAYTSTQGQDDDDFGALVGGVPNGPFEIVYEPVFQQFPAEFVGQTVGDAGAFVSGGGGGFVGGGGGGGFGGGGLGGGGRLLGLAGLITGIIAIADDDSSNPGSATPSVN